MNDKLKQMVFRLNYSYLVLLREAAREANSLAQSLWGLPDSVIQAIQEVEPEALVRMAAVGVPLFRLREEHIGKALTAAAVSGDTSVKASLIIQALGDSRD